MIDELSERLNVLTSDYEAAKKQEQTERDNLKKARRKVRDVETAQALVQSIAESVQEETHKRISAVVTKCLSTIFDQPYRFAIEFKKRRGRTEAELVYYRGDLRLTDPLYEAGGSVADIAAFALRLTCIMLSKPRHRKFVVVDEPFQSLSEENRSKVKELMLSLAEKLNVQFILITHDLNILRIGKVEVYAK